MTNLRLAKFFSLCFLLPATILFRPKPGNDLQHSPYHDYNRFVLGTTVESKPGRYGNTRQCFVSTTQNVLSSGLLWLWGKTQVRFDFFNPLWE